MTITANGRSTLILAAGLLAYLAGHCRPPPGDAAASSKPPSVAAAAPAKHASRHWKKLAHRNSGKVALKSAADQNNRCRGRRRRQFNRGPSSGIPPSVANANAQLPPSDTPSGDPKAMSARASTLPQAAPDHPDDALPAAETEVVSADQLNDVDRALHEHAAPEATLAMASAEAPAAASRNDSSTWDQTSLIGKIFIGFGALLTMASAARMFMA